MKYVAQIRGSHFESSFLESAAHHILISCSEVRTVKDGDRVVAKVVETDNGHTVKLVAVNATAEEAAILEKVNSL
jgi:hypothetical protein